MATIKRKNLERQSAARPTDEDLKLAAYYRWLERGAPQGDSQEDWYEVENKWRDNIVPTRND